METNGASAGVKLVTRQAALPLFEIELIVIRHSPSCFRMWRNNTVEEMLKATSILMLNGWLSLMQIDWFAMEQRLAARNDCE